MVRRDLKCEGSEFQICGAAMWKDRSVILLRDGLEGRARVIRLDDLVDVDGLTDIRSDM